MKAETARLLRYALPYWRRLALVLVLSLVSTALSLAMPYLVSVALVPASVWALGHYRRRLEGKVATLRQSSAEIGNFLIETVQGMKLVVTSNAQERERERFRRKNDSFVRALMSMQLLSY